MAVPAPFTPVKSTVGILLEIIHQFIPGRIRIFVFNHTVAADPPHQALSHDNIERRHELVHVDFHIYQPSDGIDDVVGVDGTQNQMTGQGRVYSDKSCFLVTYLTNHDFVGVLPYYRSQPVGKGQAFLVVDRYLDDVFDLILHRIFDSNKLVSGRVDELDAGVQSGCFAAAGRSGHQHHSVRLADVLFKADQVLFGKTETRQIKSQGSLV